MSETYFVKQHRKENFTILDNTCIRDSNLSWKAKGVHTYLMSLPDDWKIHISEIVNHSCDGKAALYSAIKMLEQYGYIKKIRNRRKDGCFENTLYQVFEAPEAVKSDVELHPLSDFPDVDNPDMENPVLDNRTLLTTNKLNTDKQRTELTNSDCKSETEQSGSESVFINIIKSLFVDEYPFDEKFEEAVLKHLTETGIEEKNLEAYLNYVFERTKLGNVKKSFVGLFRKLAMSNSITRDFKDSSFIKESEKELNVEQKINYVDCPICCTRFKEFYFKCPTCGVSVNEIKDQKQVGFIVKKKIYELSDSEKESYESALNDFTLHIKERTGRPFLLESEKKQFWRKYGFLDL